MRRITKTIAATITLVLATTIAGIVAARPAAADGPYCINWDVVVVRTASADSTTSADSTEAAVVDGPAPGEESLALWLMPGGPSRICLFPIRP